MDACNDDPLGTRSVTLASLFFSASALRVSLQGPVTIAAIVHVISIGFSLATLSRNLKINQETTNSSLTKDLPRCQHRTRTGHRCRFSVLNPQSHLCFPGPGNIFLPSLVSPASVQGGIPL
jgi:hypothetical protein